MISPPSSQSACESLPTFNTTSLLAPPTGHAVEQSHQSLKTLFPLPVPHYAMLHIWQLLLL